MRWSLICILLVALLSINHPFDAHGQDTEELIPFHDLVRSDLPVFHLSFQDGLNQAVQYSAEDAVQKNSAHSFISGTVVGSISTWEFAARPPIYPAMGTDNLAAIFDGASYLRFGEDSNEFLKFGLDDEITLEAWVMPQQVPEGQQIYIVGKGRTARKGFVADNQNYALRLRGKSGQACVSFLFRNEQNRSGNRDDFHRWTSNVGFVADDQWHHIAVTYRFGDGESIRGYVDGKRVEGEWDIGGATDAAPFIDDDELWVGSSIGGNSSCSFRGALDEVAIYRRCLSDQAIASRAVNRNTDTVVLELADQDLPEHVAVVELFEGLDAGNLWGSRPTNVALRYEQPWMAFQRLPKKYQTGAIVVDRATPYLLRSRIRISLAEGDHRFLVRAKSATRLSVDDEVLVELPFMSKNSSGHEAVPPLIEPLFEGMHPVAPGHREKVVEFKNSETREVVLTFETVIGGPGVRAELGEACVAIANAGSVDFRIVTGDVDGNIRLDEPSWRELEHDLSTQIVELERALRQESDAAIAEYWKERHHWAREYAMSNTPMSDSSSSDGKEAVANLVDEYFESLYADKDINPLEPVDDFAFLRRASLDTVGVVPTMLEWETYFADPAPVRRSKAIDRLLSDPRWADHWVSYWQDVLAENPGILKPKLNNTGPFRFWIYESFLDNKPMDRFATELIEMRGSTYGGAPAGFRLATQNDVPMAAKALVLGQAFLGTQMECARCHDSPVRESSQEQLFSLAAMLNRQPIKLPKTSSVPTGPDGHHAAVSVTLNPGDEVDGAWPFDNSILDSGALETLTTNGNLNRWLRRPGDSREKLAWLITTPQNERFAQVIVNRLWQRWMGLGFVEPVDDWENGEQIHTELMETLAWELTANGYDLKHLARLILNSNTYQRRIDAEGQLEPSLFAGRKLKRLSAEQLVDSLYVSVGKSMSCESITFDPEGRRPADTFLNLGRPQRAWEFASLSNERDRPALALPRAQSVIDLLICFGWRDSRPNGESYREQELQLLQPLTLANGTAAHRVCQLSDNGELVELCLDSDSVETLVDQLTLRMIGRRLDDVARRRIIGYLEPGFAERKTEVSDRPFLPYSLYRSNVSWSNHLNAEATEIVLELEAAARRGDPPTDRLQDEWRERVEDVVWALINSPEFQFMP